jgi:hypothetical protein
MKVGDTVRVDGSEYSIIEVRPGNALIVEDKQQNQFLVANYLVKGTYCGGARRWQHEG